MILAVLNEIIGLPENASEHAAMADLMLEIVHWFMLVLGVGWSIFIGVAIWKFRESKQEKADYHGVVGHLSTHVEVAVVLAEAILLLGFAFPLWKMRSEEYPTGPDVVRVRAIGYQFGWQFHYPGEDKVFGRTHHRFLSGSNPLGQDLEDPAGTDDMVATGVLRLPVGRKIIIDITSKDVIHNLALVPMRMAQDAIPGTRSTVWFTPNKTGEWDIICGQLCGASHAEMVATLEVMPEDEFFAWNSEASGEAYAARQIEKASEPVADLK